LCVSMVGALVAAAGPVRLVVQQPIVAIMRLG
jgi:hypothetical protein